MLRSYVFLVSVALNVTVKWHTERWFRREIRHTPCALPIFLLRKMLLRSNLNDTRHYVRSMIQQCSFEMCIRLLLCKEFFNFFGCDYLYFVICVMCTNVLSGESLLRFCSTSNETILKFDSMSFVRRKESRKRIFLSSGLLNSQFNCHTCGKDGVSNSCDADIIALKLTWKTCEKNRIINQIKMTENFWDQEVRSW